jgi:tRNA uridine 5-carbamoylmethylation protein Kti12
VPNKKTRVINLYGGPGTGKSTNAARLFAMLKDEGINCELVTEYAKKLVWEERLKTFKNQIYVFAKQHHEMEMAKDDVDMIITDSPLLLNLVYQKEKTSQAFKHLVRQEYHKYNNVDILLERVKEYNPKGRSQTEEEAKSLDLEIKDMLIGESQRSHLVEGSKRGCEAVMRILKDRGIV